MTERVDPYELYADDEWDVDILLGTLTPARRDHSAAAEPTREGGDQS
jgi:hypothetical protein